MISDFFRPFRHVRLDLVFGSVRLVDVVDERLRFQVLEKPCSDRVILHSKVDKRTLTRVIFVVETRLSVRRVYPALVEPDQRRQQWFRLWISGAEVVVRLVHLLSQKFDVDAAEVFPRFHLHVRCEVDAYRVTVVVIFVDFLKRAFSHTVRLVVCCVLFVKSSLII